MGKKVRKECTQSGKEKYKNLTKSINNTCSYFITVELSEVLSSKNIPIISGMTKGIDSYSHTVELHNNYTIAVLGTGVDICYPSKHQTLMNKIIENGAVISQFETGTINVKQNFIKRNELIVMLAEKIVVVEASKDSGAIFTAKSGIKYNKDVYAVPGNINSICSIGTNMLIKEGIKPYLSPKDIASDVDDIKPEAYTKEEVKVLDLLKNKPMTLDEIKSILGHNVDKLLFEMEAKAIIKQLGVLFMTPGVKRLSKKEMNKCYKFKLNNKGNIHIGFLVLLETDYNLPFEVKRIFYTYDVPIESNRGAHAYYNTEQVLICISGSLKVK